METGPRYALQVESILGLYHLDQRVEGRHCVESGIVE